MSNEKFKLPNPELEGEIYYLTEQEGGRKSNIHTGYRGQFFYDNKNWDASQEFIDKEVCKPGEMINVRLQTTSPDLHAGQFFIGKSFEIREGAKTVGFGKITKILKQNFKYWDPSSFVFNLTKEIEPYDNQNLDAFIENIHYGLDFIRKKGKLKFTKSISNKNQMLTIECIIKDKNISARPLIDEICSSWRNEIELKNSLYKIDIKHVDNRFQFKLVFATWQENYLTGKIIIDTIMKY
ncbi:MAG: hypothetical protein N4A45_00380 [Flavobacteriales bacterium]|jgi:hypothetical protein|nr:hypothetical protein [Flavobacteriales bacterium]